MEIAIIVLLCIFLVGLSLVLRRTQWWKDWGPVVRFASFVVVPALWLSYMAAGVLLKRLTHGKVDNFYELVARLLVLWHPANSMHTDQPYAFSMLVWCAIVISPFCIYAFCKFVKGAFWDDYDATTRDYHRGWPSAQPSTPEWRGWMTDARLFPLDPRCEAVMLFREEHANEAKECFDDYVQSYIWFHNSHRKYCRQCVDYGEVNVATPTEVASAIKKMMDESGVREEAREAER